MNHYPVLMFAKWTDALPESIRKHVDGKVGTIITVVVALLAILVVAWMAAKVWKLFSGTKEVPKETRENLAEYPEPPGVGERQLIMDGTPLRVRLVVAAPGTRDMILNEENLLPILEAVMPGLGTVVQADRPRIVIWPPQLSSQGFAPTFHRQTEKPESDGQSSRWVIVAGPANAGGQKILLGLALLAAKPCLLGRRTIDPERWNEAMKTEATVGDG